MARTANSAPPRKNGRKPRRQIGGMAVEEIGGDHAGDEQRQAGRQQPVTDPQHPPWTIEQSVHLDLLFPKRADAPRAGPSLQASSAAAGPKNS